MAVTAMTNDGEGKEKAIDLTEKEELESDPSSSSSSDSDSDSNTSDTDSDESEIITEEYLESLLQKARQKLASNSKNPAYGGHEEEVLALEKDSTTPLPELDPGTVPTPYFTLGKGRNEGPSSLRDPEIERVETSTSSLDMPAPPVPPPELTKSGKPFTKKQKKELRNETAGPDWFDMPAPAEADLPRLHREVEALRLRNQLDPKRFYRKEEGEGKGIKGLPKHFAIGTIVSTNTPFGGSSGQNLTRAERKRTMVDELVDDAEAKRYAKKKFNDLQSVRGAMGKNTRHAKTKRLKF
ncbi:deoxynucleotidyltransferase terminal-interacting protein 2 [Moniliophthora roreri MCA 2997]|uniref:Deoxynucleotidyltransferase terminal-interacting protein 2 n=2 Tax=Moniliophthora roreri TaxID=221103 RepID=V2X788_MONRO|nr:deoxynucleotidyltransferase terminal-interacting protein 2 [Moniliophthora roreri MCA 2997]KAI3607959.1 deoxynucleotidyltransferase terminal-interacting protein 2 [Moniliophthora roreri]